MGGVYLEKLTWQQAKQELHSKKVIVLPVGAQTKQHGPHLPLNTDWLTAHYLTQAIVTRCDVIALPAIAYGYYPAFTTYPGSISLEENTFRDTIEQIIRGMHQHGAERFYILNTGISTNAALSDIRRSFQTDHILVDFTDLTTIIRDIEDRLEEQSFGSHADELETSMMLYMFPDKVDMEKAVPELNPRQGPGAFTRDENATTGVVSSTGSWGDPTLATVEKGKVIVEHLIDRISGEIDLLSSSG
ncbi:MAG: creatininase family protein [Gammaproteobacteria bacterium]|nr:MAG: creatininase family protein [Gammaproteobacteria bacterium]